MRDTTEWLEGIKVGTFRLVGAEEEAIENQEAMLWIKHVIFIVMDMHVRELPTFLRERNVLPGLQNKNFMESNK